MADKLDRLYLLKVPEVQEAFLEAISNIVDRAVINEMITAINNDDIETLYRVSGITPAVFDKLLNKIEEVYASAGASIVNDWPKTIKTASGVFMPVFNMRNLTVEKQLSDYSSAFITNITKEMKENIQLVLREGVQRGENPRSTALNIVGRIDPSTHKRIGGIIGLSSNQANWVLNVRKYLETLDERYLTMGLRDKRFDKVFKRAVAEKKPLTKETIERFITAYEQKALKYRADMIAQTETIAAINRAEADAINQGIEEGLITKDMVRKWWDDTGDGRTRHSHLLMGKKYSRDKAIPIDEPFVFPNGEKCMYPGDTSLGANPREIINCRCKVQYEIDFLAEATNEFKL